MTKIDTKEITTLHCEKRGDMLLEQDQRILRLELLFKEIVTDIEEDWRCYFCLGENLKTGMQHTEDCFIIRLKKEFGI